MSIYTKDILKPWIDTRGFEIGDHTYGGPNIHSWHHETSRLIIGRYCSIGGAVNILMGGNHRVDWVTTYPFGGLSHLWPAAADRTDSPVSRGDIRIGNDVWIGQYATILSGVTIGDGAVIGTETVVVRDVPPYAIVGGNPAKVLRKRFPDEVIERLLRIRWWDWPDEKVQAVVPLLLSNDLGRFLDTYDPPG